jgi:hypothetical protein
MSTIPVQPYSVRDHVVALMRAFPSLYRNRLMALMAVFEGTEYRWVNGGLVRIEDLCRGRSSHLPYPEALEPNGLDGKDVSQRLLALRENAAADFVHQHADLLADHHFGRLEKEHHVDFNGRNFDSMPADVQPEWKDAALELATAILAHKPLDAGSYDARYQASRAQRHADSQALCRQFMERHRRIAVCPLARRARVEALMREAGALGLAVVEASS